MRAPVLCFALKLMRTSKKPLLALLLAALLPMRGFTFATHCEPHGPGQGAQALHCVDGPKAHPTDHEDPQRPVDDKGAAHADSKGGGAHAHGCGDCCYGAAAVLTTPRFAVPRAAAVLVVGRLARPHLALSNDRLDRPPRQPTC
jgi:hypothetical protein